MILRSLQVSLAALAVVTFSALGTAVQAEDDWRILFDGKTLEGWEQHGGKAVYAVEEGAIVGHSVPQTSNSFLCTKERFRDFELMFEVQVDNALNSGVQIRSNIKGNDRVYGPQVEIEAAPGDAGYIYGEATGRGWLSKERSNTDAFKNGQWNEFRVLAKGTNIKTFVNGEPVADLTDEACSQEGLIGLQVHGVGGREEPLYVRWRNLKIRELK
ncbi:MAG: 3-keto-disaccharide hydrolase [Thermoguttaceae bacterium]